MNDETDDEVNLGKQFRIERILVVGKENAPDDEMQAAAQCDFDGETVILANEMYLSLGMFTGKRLKMCSECSERMFESVVELGFLTDDPDDSGSPPKPDKKKLH